MKALTKAQRRTTLFISVTGQKLYTVGVETVHYLPASVVQLVWPFHPTRKYTHTHTHTHHCNMVKSTWRDSLHAHFLIPWWKEFCKEKYLFLHCNWNLSIFKMRIGEKGRKRNAPPFWRFKSPKFKNQDYR